MADHNPQPPTHDGRGRTPAAAQRDATLAAIAHKVYPQYVNADRVQKALRGLRDGVACYNARGQFVGATTASSLLSSLGDIRVAKAKGAAPVAVYDANGDLIGVVDADKLVVLGKDESYVYNASGSIVGIVGADRKVRDIAVAPAKPAAAPADDTAAPVTKARRPFKPTSTAEAMLRGLARGPTARSLVTKGLAQATDEVALGAVVYGRLAPERQRVFDTLLALVGDDDRALLASKVQKAQAPNSGGLLRALSMVRGERMKSDVLRIIANGRTPVRR